MKHDTVGHIEKSGALTEYYSAKQLKEDMKHRDVAWHQKFNVTHELRESLARSQESTDASFRETHSRIDACIRDLVPRAEVDKRMNVLVKEVQVILDKLHEAQGGRASLADRLGRLEHYINETFATKRELETTEKRMCQSVHDNTVIISEQIDSVRRDSAPLTDVNERFDRAADRSAAIEQTCQGLRKDLGQTNKNLEDLRYTTEDRFAKKLALKELHATLMLEVQRRDDSHMARVDDIHASHASKKLVDDKVASCHSGLEETRSTLAEVVKSLDEKKGQLAELEKLCRETLATRTEVQGLDVAIRENRSAAKTLAATVTKQAGEIETERDRVLSLFRSLQSDRNDITQLTLQHQSFLELQEDYGRFKSANKDFGDSLEHREREHFQEMRSDLMDQKLLVERLRDDLASMSEECVKMAEKHEVATSIIKEQQATKYMEAMDKALSLSDTVIKHSEHIEADKKHKQRLQAEADHSIPPDLPGFIP